MPEQTAEQPRPHRRHSSTFTILSPHCGINPESTSGGEVYERELLSRMTGVQHDILLARHQSYTCHAHWRMHDFPIGRGLRWWVAPFLVPGAILRVARQHRPDLVRVHSLRFMGPSAILAQRRGLTVPLVAHHHHLDPGHRALERWVVQHMDAVIVGSHFAKRQLARAGFRTDHVRVVPYGVDAARFTPGPTTAGPRLVTIGGKARKRAGMVLQAWDRVRGVHPLAEVCVLGGPPIRDPGVRVLPYVPEAEKPALLRTARAFVSASQLEGFGLAVAEAMACGVPVVIPHESETLRELVGAAGVRFAGVEGLAQALIHLLCDPEGAQEIGLRGRARIETDFTWERCVADTLAVYREVARRAR